MGILLAAGLTTAGLYGLYYRVFTLSVYFPDSVYSAVKRKRPIMLGHPYKKESLGRGSMPIQNCCQSALEGSGRVRAPALSLCTGLDDQLKEKGILNESEIVNGLLDFGAQTQVASCFINNFRFVSKIKRIDY